MARKTRDKHNLETLHPIDAFGVQRVSLSGIRVERLEARVKPAVAFPHKHDFFQILLVTSGQGEHQIDFISHLVGPGQIYMMKPGQMHSWTLVPSVRGLVVEFHYQSLNSLKESARLMHEFTYAPDLFTVAGKKNFNQLVELAEIMLKESEAKREMHDLSLQGYLTAFLINLIRLYQKQLKQEKILSVIDKFRALLEKNFKQAHGVEFYARELGTTSKALTMQLSRAIGKPPRQLIQERILLEAKRYLAFSGLSIAEIGYELGFEDANYFSRFFRIHEKQTPAGFRKEKG